MKTEIILKYPTENTVLFGDKLQVHYTLSSFTDREVYSVKMQVDDVVQIKSDTEDQFVFENLKEGTHTFSCELLRKNGTTIKGTEKSFIFNTFENTLNVDKKLTYVLKSTIPDFVKEDYPNFIIFLQAYYEWLYSSNNPFYAPLISENFKDIDKTPDFFLRYYREQYLKDFPESLTKDKETGTPLNIKTLLKRISDFYSSKGTEKSIKFLLKILYDSYSEIYYPSKDIFKSSASEWILRDSIKFTFSSDNIFNIKNLELYQQRGEEILSKCLIKDLQVYKSQNKKIVEIFYDSLIGEFDFTESFYVKLEDEIITLSPVLVVNGYEIAALGLNFKVNDAVKIYKQEVVEESTGIVPDPKRYLIAILKVSSVNEYGGITELKFVNFGVTQDVSGNYEIEVVSESGEDFELLPLEGYICDYSGFWQNKNSHPSSIKKIADNKRYQNFSYVVRTDRSLDRYIEPLKKLAHPAGVEVLGDILIQKEIQVLVTITDQQLSFYTPLIGNYVAFRLNTSLNIRDDINDLFPNGFDPTSPIPYQLGNSSDFVHEIGSNGPLSEGVQDLIFKYLPDVSDIDERNNYWVVYPHPNTEIDSYTDSDFLNIKLLDFLKQQQD